MNARDYGKRYDYEARGTVDELADWIGTGEGRTAIEAHDAHWAEVMELAGRHGFICQAYGGAAVLATNAAYMEANGPGKLADRLRMNGVEL